MKFKITPKVVIRGTLTRTFGTDQSWGQSIGLVFEDARLVEGCIYKDTEKDVYKGFAWDEVYGTMPHEEGVNMTEDDALPKYKTSYGSTDKEYELVDARIDGQSDPMPIGDGDIILWYGGTEDNGPKSASLRLGMLLHPDGNDNVLSEDDVHNWLGDTSGTNWLRDDLKGGEFDYFIEKRDSSESDYQYHYPVLVKSSIGERVVPVGNSGANNSANDTVDESSSNTSEAPVDSVPEPVDSFIGTAQQLDMDDDEEDKMALLNDLIEDPENEMTVEMVDEIGGKTDVVEMV